MNSSEKIVEMAGDAPPPELDAPHLPRLTRRLFGHQHVVEIVAQAAQGGRMPHGWLLTGPRGVGKASFAYLLARAVLGQRDITSLTQAINDESDHLIAEDAHPDLFVLKRKYDFKTEKISGVIKVDDVRDLEKHFTLTSAWGGWRVCIIDALDDMNKYGVNALLKILEEPPPKSLFLIICHNSGMVLDTVRSRCQHLPFNELQPDELRQVLGDLYPDSDDDERGAVAYLAEGSSGMAVRIMEADGLAMYREMVAIFSHLPRADIEAVHGLAARFSNRAEHKEPFLLFAFLLQGWLYRLVRCQSRFEAPTPIFDGEAALLDRFVKNLRLEPIIALWEKIGADVSIVEEYNLDRKNTVLNWLETASETLEVKPN